MARPLFLILCRTEGHGLLLMRTRPGSTTVKASRSREPNLDTASITVADLARRARLGTLPGLPRLMNDRVRKPIRRNRGPL